MLRLEFAAKAGHSGSHDASPKFLGMVVGSLKEMVGTFVLDSKSRVVSVSVCLKMSSVQNVCLISPMSD